jgi:hypothetical protein
MFAWKLHKVRFWLGMAGRTGIEEPIGHGDLAWGVRVSVACAAVLVCRAVDIDMARRTLGHQRIIVIFLRIIGMKGRMTPLTLESMPATVILQRAKLADVTLGALGG